MKRKNIIRVLLLSLMLMSLSMPSLAEQKLAPLKSFYAYDKALPLNAEVKEDSRSRSTVTYEIFFDSIHDQRISSLLTVPLYGKKPFPVVLYLHGIGMSRDLPGMATDFIASGGYALFVLSAQYTNERKRANKSLLSPYLCESRNALIQTVVDYMRGIDYLETRDDVDCKRMGILGLSLGTIEGSILFSLDKRIRMACFAVGGGNFGLMAEKSVLLGPAFGVAKDEILRKELMDTFSPVDPVNFAHLSQGRPVLMVNGKKDMIILPESAKALYDALGEPKHIIWFEGGHVPSMDVILSLVKRLLSWLKVYLVPETLPLVKEEVNQPPKVKELIIKAPPELCQNGVLRFEAKAEDPDKNIIFVKVHLDADNSEALLYDDGRAGYDKKAGDGIFSGRAHLSYDARIGKSKVRAVAVDYNGKVSKELLRSIEVLPIKFPEGTHPPKIEKVSIPREVKIGGEIRLKVEVSDEDGDIKEVEATLEELGLSEPLEREGDSNVFSYKLKIPDMELIPTGTFHVSIRAKDRTYQYSEKVTYPLTILAK